MSIIQHLEDKRGERAKQSWPAPLRGKSKRARSWHASHGVLALLTSLMILNGCDNQGPTQQAGTQVDEAVQDMNRDATVLGNASVDAAAPSAAPETALPSADASSTGEAGVAAGTPPQ